EGPTDLLLHAMDDHRGIGGDRPRVVGHQQGSAGAGDVFQALPLGPEPVPVEGAEESSGQSPVALGAAPLIHVAQSPGVERGVVGKPHGRQRSRALVRDLDLGHTAAYPRPTPLASPIALAIPPATAVIPTASSTGSAIAPG